MIIIKLMGGLGNQMFQFAFASAYLSKGIQVKFDLSYYEIDNRHGGYCLEKAFPNIKAIKASKRDLFYFVEKVKGEQGDLGYLLKKDRFIVEEEKEDEFFCDATLSMMDNTFFSGYWQNENYFQQKEDMVKRYFEFKQIPDHDSINKEIENLIFSNNAVALHIRRGDYLQSPMHRTLTINYYLEAINIMKSKTNNPYFFIFSDDIPWAKKNIKEQNAIFVNNNNHLEKSYIDMQLMSYCKHNIIANSTFSWWGTWLNNYPQKIIVAPKRWFNTDVNVERIPLQNSITI